MADPRDADRQGRLTPAAQPRAGAAMPVPLSRWPRVAKRTVTEFKADNLTDLAAALTYYGVLSIFPALLALVSILGLLGRATLQPLINNVGSLAPGAARQLISTFLTQLHGSQGKASLALIVGIAVAVWSASGYVAAFMRAANIVYDISEGRPVWKTLPVRVVITLAAIIALVLLAIGVVFTGTLAHKTGVILGVGHTAQTAWTIAKWPVMIIIASVLISLLYWAAPNVKPAGFRWLSAGSVLAVGIWLIASAAFGLYVASFSSYSKTYGSLASIIVFLIWLWITNVAILLGLEFNAELDRERAIQTGHPPGAEPYTEPRDTRKQ